MATVASASLTPWASSPSSASRLPFSRVSLINSWARSPVSAPGGPLVAHHHLRRHSSAVVFALARRPRRRINSPSRTKGPSRSKAAFGAEEDEEDDGGDDLDALFQQLEEDLKNGRPSIGEDITEEDVAELEQELAEAFGDSVSGSENSDGDGDETEKVGQPELKNWQLRRMARALKIGKRKIKIKSFAAELGLDRAFVLELLRNPTPNLLVMSACLPDEEIPCKSGSKSAETRPPGVAASPTVIESPMVEEVDAVASKPKVNLPVHAMRAEWSAQKRMKKVQVETLERVYERTKRPTDAMVSSIIQVTNLPRKRVVKWFEDKRLQDGVPQHRAPYIKPTSFSKKYIKPTSRAVLST